MIVLTPRRSPRPQSGSGLNMANPITRSMRYAFTFNEGGGTRAINLAKPLAPSAPDGMVGSAAKFGPYGIDFANNSNSNVSIGDDNNIGGAAVTVACRFRMKNLTGLQAIFGDNESGGNENQLSIYVESSKISVWSTPSGTGTSVQSINGTATLIANRSYDLAIVATPPNFSSYLDGSLDDSGAAGSAASSRTSADVSYIGRAGGYTSAMLQGYIEYFHVWTRALSASEIMQLRADPYALVSPNQASRFYMTQPAAGGGGSFNPAWALGSNRMIGQGLYVS